MNALSERYCALFDKRARETEPRETPGELELQARWFAGEFGTRLHATDGRRVEIVQFGVWNRGPGPDFLEAAVRLEGGETRRGDIELDLDPADWERHGHAGNPDFENVVLHLFVHEESGRESFTRTPMHRQIPRARLDLNSLLDTPVATLPLAKPGRCTAPLRAMGAARATALLHAAARYRLERKSARYQRLASAHGPDEALWQMLAIALGYRENSLVMQLLAQRLPLRLLRAKREEAEALLFGLAGFAHGREFGDDAGPTREYLRSLWEKWWPRRGEWARLVLTRGAWKMRATRPANHPHRRVAALAALARNWPKVSALLENADPAKSARAVFGALADRFWDHHFTLGSEARPERIALLGESRIAEILANVIFPAVVPERPEMWERYLALPAVLTNRRVETAAARLLGGPAALRREMPQTTAIQQGLLQVYEDFCLRDATDCARCTFPERASAFDPSAGVV